MSPPIELTNGRKKTRHEYPHRGSARPDLPLCELAVVKGVNSVDRTLSLDYLNRSGGEPAAPVWADTGDYSLPAVNDQVFVFIDRATRPQVLGMRDYNFSDKVAANQLPTVLAGEKCIYNSATGARLHFRANGDVLLLTEREEGLEIKPGERVKLKAPALMEVIGSAGKIAFGDVRRRQKGMLPTVPTSDDAVINPSTGVLPHREFTVEVKAQVLPGPITGLQRAARFSMGTGVIDNDGQWEQLKSFGTNLRAILEITALTGTPLSSIQMDEVGNIEIFSTLMARIRSNLAEVIASEITLKASQITLGRFRRYSALLSELFLIMYNTHTHSTPLGPTSPPQPIAVPAAVLSKTVGLE